MLKRPPSWLAPVFVIVAALIVAVATIYFEPNYQQAKAEANTKGGKDASDILASERVAYYTKVLAIFTAALTATGAMQGYLIYRQVSLARDEFNATHRPRLTIRSISVFSPPSGEGDTVLNFTVRNTGEAPGVITEVIFYSIIKSKVGQIDPIITLKNPFVPTKVSVGDSVNGVAIIGGDWAKYIFSEDRLTDIISNTPEGEITLRITVVYTDSDGRGRETSIIRRYSADTNRFSRIENSEFEYAD